MFMFVVQKVVVQILRKIPETLKLVSSSVIKLL